MKTEAGDSSNEIVWAFDLGKGSIGEAVRRGNEFLHKASLLIPAEFAETKTAAGRRRMFRTREAHKARERWLNEVMQSAGIEILKGRQIGKVDEQGNEISKSEWKKKKGKWVQIAKGDYRLEREFPPRKFQKNKDGKLEPVIYPDGKAKDGAPAKTDEDFSTCYNSALLRIKLLRGEELKPWQIFKALRSAIQKRGYGKIPWAEKEARRAGKSIEELEKEEQKKDANYVAALNRWRDFKKQVPADSHFPCYYDAWKMGLWDPKAPDRLASQLKHDAESTRNVRFDRTDVENEIKKLIEEADRQLNGKLDSARRRLIEEFRNDRVTRIRLINERRRTKNKSLPRDKQKKLLKEPKFEHTAENIASFLINGPTGLPYASYFAATRREFGLRQGSTDDWLGALGQKIPRFDNRILNDCVVIPRFHVCKAEIRQDAKTGKPIADSLLPAEVTFLMKLKNTLVAGAKAQRKLTVEEICKIYEVVSTGIQDVEADAKDWAKKVASRLSLTDTSWARKKGVKELGLFPLPGHGEVKPPRHSGRSAFSRPALKLLKALILSGKSPQNFYQEQIAALGGNTDEKKGLVPRDLKFLSDMGDSWDDIHIPAQKLEALAARHTENGKLDVDMAVADLLADINDPVVRHRLNVFAGRLRFLRDKYGEPQEVVLEFVREDFMGPKRLNELLQFQRDREKARKEAREKATEAGAEEKSAALKYELCKAQGCVCLYCGQPFAASKLDEYRIEHIVPRSQNGPDAMVNYVLAHDECNEAKSNQTPFQWWHNNRSKKAPSISWDGYKRLVDSCATSLRNKKVQLLLREDAPELAQRYTALAETAWVSKLAQTIASLFFGWENGNDKQGHKRVAIISGGLTGRIRRKYRLNSILNPCPDGEDPFLWEEKCEKNRKDDRHHALDAMVISFLPTWARDTKKEGFFRFPEGVHQEYFAREIEDVRPKYIALEKAALEAKFYGLRTINGQKFIVGRESLAALAVKVANNRETLKARKDIETHRIVDGQIRRDVEGFWEKNPSATLEEWKAWCQSYRLGGRGARVENILVTKSKADSIEEYKDVAKHDGDAQRGQFKRGAKHRGYFIYERPAPTKKDAQHTQIEVRPVFVFEGKQSVHEELRQHLGWKIHGYFESGCQVSLEKIWQFREKTYPAGEYILKSVWANRNAELKHPQHGEIGPVGLRILLDAGFKRIGNKL